MPSYSSLIVTCKDKSQVDLAKILVYFENELQESYHIPGEKKSQLKKSKIGVANGLLQNYLDWIVAMNRPSCPIYWLNKLYKFYQLTENKGMDLESVINQLITPVAKQLKSIRNRICNLYIKLPSDHIARPQLLADWGELFKQYEELTEQMPAKLLVLAKKYGSKDDKSLVPAHSLIPS